MPEISTQTMCIAIELLAKEVHRLRELVQAHKDEPELQQMLEDYERSADELERAYDKEAETILNLPPWDMLMPKSPR
jgi:uncharacterized protein Yka (UPF0111/DUF47 family)